jgi:hypothetical protein
MGPENPQIASAGVISNVRTYRKIFMNHEKTLMKPFLTLRKTSPTPGVLILRVWKNWTKRELIIIPPLRERPMLPSSNLSLMKV